MAKTNDFSYEIKKRIGSLGENSDKQLNIIAWNGREAKIDVRAFFTDKEGNEKMGKGVSLTNDEAKKLVDLLTEYFAEDEDDDF